MSYRLVAIFSGLCRCALILLPLISLQVRAAAPEDTLGQQRAKFMLVWEMAQHGPDDAWRKLAHGLEDYPLYPYLELAGLQRNLAQLQPAQADKFIKAWPG